MLTFVLGIAIGQGLAFSGAVSPADFHVRAQRAWQGHDDREALQFWNHAVALQPTDPNVHYLRGTALARLGLRLSALDAFQMALLLDPSPALARRVQADIAELNQLGGSAGARETTVPLERSLGVPFAVTFHALGKVRRRHQGEADGFPDARFAIEDRVVREADAIVAECPQDEVDLMTLYGADPDKVVTVPCGFDPGEFWPGDRAQVLERRRDLCAFSPQ